MIDAYLADLAARLERLGVRGRSAERVLAEARDHLEEAARRGDDPLQRFGDPRTVARLVAAELATSGTRRATFAAFGALALTGIGYVFVLSLVPAAGGWPDIYSGRVSALGPVAGIGMVVLPQIAFVAGSLALLGALRLRAAPTAQREQLGLLRRRSNVALAAAAGSLLVVAVTAVNDSGELAGWWTWSTIAACTVLGLPLGGAAYLVSDSACPSAPAGGSTGDVFDDLGPLFRIRLVRPLDLPRHPWRFAVTCAVAVGLAGLVAGWYVEGDAGSGLVRGGFEAVALPVCFAFLGRTLGLRQAKR